MKNVLLTGSRSSLGKGIREGLEKAGCRVFGVGLLPEEDLQYNLQYCLTDSDASIIFNEAETSLGAPVDILVNNAGMTSVNFLEDQDPARDWSPVIHLNLTVPYLLSRYFIELVKAKQEYYGENKARVVNICSMAIKMAHRCSTAYNCSKAGLAMLTKSMGRECANRLPITFCSINPSAIEGTNMINGVIANMVAKRGFTPTEARAYASKEAPIGRMSTIEEVVKVVTFMALEAPEYMTGTAIDFTGGGAV
jgi:NAD(P)-dependent dehydrogenase (short-subunit alcohol dehydrogenase family)